ncbi:Reverse transcriptase zinc-binding domain [Sesbania bispinosa]|nr:Reverse transcriptase zinc-binding domain [Sesbania bispinosa]
MQEVQEYTVDSWSWIWRTLALENIRFMLWLICHNSLSTKDTLSKHGLPIDVNCSFCGNEPENIFHCLQDYPRVRLVWNHAGLGSLITNDQSINLGDWLSIGIKHGGALFLASFWSIWKSRNRFIFDNKSDTVMEISQEIQTLTEIIQRVFNSGHGTTTPTKTPRFISWESPEMDQVALNIDGSVTDTTTGVGGIIRGHDGRWIMGFCGHTTSRENMESEPETPEQKNPSLAVAELRRRPQELTVQGESLSLRSQFMLAPSLTRRSPFAQIAVIMGVVDPPFLEHHISEGTLQLLFGASNSSNLEKSLEILILNSKSDSGRLDLASKRVLPAVLNIVQSLTHASHHNHHVLSLCFKLLRNLCAGEVANQNSFLELDGVVVFSSILRSEAGSSGPDHGLVRWGLQVLANVSLAGKQHQRAIWEELYPVGFVSFARLGTKEACDPLCMVIYTCCDGNPEWFRELSSDRGWSVVAEIVRTASSAGFDEDWIKLLLSRICLDESQLPVLFPKLRFVNVPEVEDTESKDDQFSSEQAFLLQILSEILNERIRDITVSKDVALFVFGIFKKSIGVLDHAVKGKCGLPSGSAAVDVLGYSLTILRDICAQDSVRDKTPDANDVVDVLLSYGLIELLLSLLGDLEPPAIIRKGIKQFENQDGASCSSKPCPYKGFRRDIVALIGNCVYRRKHAQDEIRHRNGILLLLQQCVTDEDNPFLREWSIWSVRNMLEGNEENQKVVAELELQGSADVPEISALGLRVEVDQRTRRAKLVNVS